MKVVHITADIISLDDHTIYRVYIDDEMMTERTVYWTPWKQYVKENMVIQVEEGTTHTVRVVSVRPKDRVSLRNVTVDGKKSEATFIC